MMSHSAVLHPDHVFNLLYDSCFWIETTSVAILAFQCFPQLSNIGYSHYDWLFSIAFVYTRLVYLQ